MKIEIFHSGLSIIASEAGHRENSFRMKIEINIAQLLGIR
jgi:hypothetical protein